MTNWDGAHLTQTERDALNTAKDSATFATALVNAIYAGALHHARTNNKPGYQRYLQYRVSQMSQRLVTHQPTLEDRIRGWAEEMVATLDQSTGGWGGKFIGKPLNDLRDAALQKAQGWLDDVKTEATRFLQNEDQW
jgi:hypothetical protein